MSRTPDEFDAELPPEMAGGLRELFGRAPAVPASLDRTILDAARGRFAARRRNRMMIRWATGLATAAAACVAIALMLNPGRHQPPLAQKPPLKGDLDASGKVDMVDALLLARRIASADRPDPAWDVNGDGKVDAADADAVARSAVALQPTGQAAAPRLPSFDELGIGNPARHASHPRDRSVALDHGHRPTPEGRP
ncbi:MAG: dockerin type I repeat-containing protein [Phycisphaerae bacterium]